MKNKLLGVAVQLAFCPGSYRKSDVCDECVYANQPGCADAMARSCTRTIQACLGEPVQIFEQTASQANLSVRVSEVLHDLGVPAHVLGYHYLRRAILMAVEDMHVIHKMTRGLYPTVAREFNTTGSRVERAIRHAIELCWERADIDILHKVFGYTVSVNKDKPTNSEFIALVADNLRLEREVKVRDAGGEL